MKKLSIIILSIIVVSAAYSQQLPVYSQYMFNKMLINPAVTGVNGEMEVQMSVRQQWVGFDNAPSTQILSFSTKLDQLNMGLGGLLFADRFGAERKMGLQFNYSYMIPVFNEDAMLSFGIAFQLFHYSLDYTQMVAIDETDPNIFMNKESRLLPESDFGIYLVSDDYFAGLSANQIIGIPVKAGGEEIMLTRMVRQFNLFGGYKFYTTPEIDIEPSLYIKSTFKAPAQLDFNVRGIYQDDYWIGFSYRTSGDIITLLGIRYNEFDFGIAADFTTSSLSSYQSGSYELVIKYRIPVRKSIGKSMFN